MSTPNTYETGFLVRLLTLLVEALKITFDDNYPTEDFRNVLVSLEYPAKKENYPSIWVDFDPTGELETVGIDHHEIATDDDDAMHRFERWRFQGYASFTIVSFTSWERARLFDEVVRVLAFGKDMPQTAKFRQYIEDNEFLAVNFDFDQIGVAGSAATPGTPWGTDEVIYEITVRMETVGEFVSDGTTAALVPLSAIVPYPYADNQPDPVPGSDWV